ncbi:unnamed protein product [Clavelina lepadiformis]|uniref:Small ribosomal subunit protein mS31 n=2 Tax=Clavelina lepadiformis TaxID=159417 RepID=A0ABP0EVW3_CLALP
MLKVFRSTTRSFQRISTVWRRTFDDHGFSRKLFQQRRFLHCYFKTFPAVLNSAQLVRNSIHTSNCRCTKNESDDDSNKNCSKIGAQKATSPRPSKQNLATLLEDIGLEFHPKVNQVKERKKMKQELSDKMSSMQAGRRPRPRSFEVELDQVKAAIGMKHKGEMFKPVKAKSFLKLEEQLKKQKPKAKQGMEEVVQRKIFQRTQVYEEARKQKPGTTDEYSRQVNQEKRFQRTHVYEDLSLNLESAGRLGIFSRDDPYDEPEVPDTDSKNWSACDWYTFYENEFQENFDRKPFEKLPGTAYDEMIAWTKEGKLWNFPVNNEQGLEEEANTPFYEHVFLEDKLNEGNWCPSTGPIRQFMNAVITVLSLNPYYSVKEKHEHIEWFRDYFLEKESTLKRLGLIEQTAS